MKKRKFILVRYFLYEENNEYDANRTIIFNNINSINYQQDVIELTEEQLMEYNLLKSTYGRKDHIQLIEICENEDFAYYMNRWSNAHNEEIEKHIKKENALRKRRETIKRKKLNGKQNE